MPAKPRILPLFAFLFLLVATSSPLVSFAGDPAPAPSVDDLTAALRATETAFAKTMADRDAAAFATFLADETVFFSGEKILRGKDVVAQAWSRFFEGDAAPFSWTPEAAAVLESGTLGLTSGPVYDPEGNRVGTFNSVWRRGADGSWKIVFDRGCPDCDCP